jgi:hypothetical protein
MGKSVFRSCRRVMHWQKAHTKRPGDTFDVAGPSHARAGWEGVARETDSDVSATRWAHRKWVIPDRARKRLRQHRAHGLSRTVF